ncbi:MAG: LarC family nickel insertion protein, partial [Micropruina sp.]
VGVGSGSIRTAHGQIPVPVPAVVELARGWHVLAGGEGELATPTGMALITALADQAPALPDCRLIGVGIGAGSRDDPGRPNVVRLVLGELVRTEKGDTATGGVSDALVLEANVDDLDPRLWPGVLTALLDAGADDAWLTPILMKKGRPAHTLHVLAGPDELPALRDRVFDLVPTLGLREFTVTKRALARLWRPVRVGEAEVRIKVGLRHGRISSATPEFADVVDAAEATGRPARDLLAAANAAASEAGLIIGATLPEHSPAGQ